MTRPAPSSPERQHGGRSPADRGPQALHGRPALEDRGSYNDAVALLQQAQKLDPESVAILRRLSRIYIGAMGRPDQAVELGKKVLAVEPGDTDTLGRLVEFYTKKNDGPSAEALLALLKEVLANPKLEAHAAGRLVAQNELGKLYSGRIRNQIDNAAKAYAEVMAGLDDKSANKLSPLDQARILGNEPATAYLNFGMVFLAAKKDDLAVKAFERGLGVRRGESADPPAAGRNPPEAEQGAAGPGARGAVHQAAAPGARGLRADGQGAHRPEAGKRDHAPARGGRPPRLQERSPPVRAGRSLPGDRPGRQGRRALQVAPDLAAHAPDLPGAGGLAAEAEEGRRPAQGHLRGHVPAQRAGGDSAQLQAAAADDALAEQMLDAGLEQLKAKPPTLPKTAFFVLSFIANPDRGADKAGRLERLIKLQRLLLEQNPNPQVYREIADTLRRHGPERGSSGHARTDDGEISRPRSRGGTCGVLAELLRRAGKIDAAVAAARQAAQLDPNDVEVQIMLADILGDTGKVDEALEIFRKAIQHEPDNARYRFLMGGMLDQVRTQRRRHQGLPGSAQAIRQPPKRWSSSPTPTSRSSTSTRAITPRERPSSRSSSSGLPTMPGVNNDLGYLYAEQGKNLEKAEAMIRKAVQEEPDRPAYLDSLGWVLFKRGKAKEALEPLIKAVELQKREEKKGVAPPDATIREHLGDVYLHLQEVDRAKKIWEEAEQIAAKAVPVDKRLPEIRKKLGSLKALGSLPKSSSAGPLSDPDGPIMPTRDTPDP